MIDIIIPIYNAFDDMVACLDSVSQHTTKEARIILINDCSTDERIVQYLNQPEVTEREDIKVIQNKENIGFVGSVNLGMRMSTNDVILLNSDTIVTKGWIDKIRRCAASDPKIGTITPLSNNAEICSFPIPSQNNPLDDTDLDLVSETIEEMSLRLYPTLPTAVGFCMFIRRTMLNEIGLFDMETFGAGYGEENDLSMRACEAGYRNVLCDDTYIAHIGSSSFGAEKHVMVDRNTQRLLDRHPRYPHQVESYLLLDPLGPVRALPRFQLAIKQSTEPGTLTVLFNQSLESALELEGEIEKDSKAPHTHLLLITDTTCHLIFRHTSPNLGFKFGLETNESWSDFIFRLCKTFNIGEFHVGDEIDESHEFLNCFPESRSGLVSAITKATAATPFSKYRLYLAAQQNSYDYLLSASSYKLDVEQQFMLWRRGLKKHNTWP